MAIFRNPMARREAFWGYLMIAPVIIGLALFFYYALGTSLYISMTQWDVLTAPQWVGFDNYTHLLSDPIFQKSLVNTAYYTLLSVPSGLIVSLLLALALNTRIRFRNVYRLIFFLPVLTMPIAIAVVWRWIYNPDFGLLNLVLKTFGVPRIKWLSDASWAIPSLTIFSVWAGSGYGMVIFLAGLQNIPREYYEAAEVDGANRWQLIRYVTLPLLTPTIFFNLVTSFISACQVFDVIYGLYSTNGGKAPEYVRSIVYIIYDEGFHFFRMGNASAAAWILFIIILIITIVQLRVQKRWVHYM